jgi:hypothetical protein
VSRSRLFAVAFGLALACVALGACFLNPNPPNPHKEAVDLNDAGRDAGDDADAYEAPP